MCAPSDSWQMNQKGCSEFRTAFLIHLPTI